MDLGEICVAAAHLGNLKIIQDDFIIYQAKSDNKSQQFLKHILFMLEFVMQNMLCIKFYRLSNKAL